MFTGDGQKFVGDDGSLYHATFGSETAGDGVTPLPVGVYLVISVGSPSGFPAAVDGGASTAVGDVLDVKTGVSIVPETDDDVVELILEERCDI